ncbi:MAG: hypothetical protein A2W22_04090 [Candidatus Levybacteria bacterium RBG_16_35_11]|nr:MAG: hypothetical protein A2W22_04090 [Candidatus Levybacteria bacterium RBG_16_35_11]
MNDTTKPWGHEIIFTKKEDPYTGKILCVNSGKQFSLQIHDEKEESQMLVSGEAILIIDNNKGEQEEIKMVPFKGYKIRPGQRHRIRAVTDCAIYEVSTPEVGTTLRLEDDYHRPDQTDKLRWEERKGLK